MLNYQRVILWASDNSHCSKSESKHQDSFAAISHTWKETINSTKNNAGRRRCVRFQVLLSFILMFYCPKRLQFLSFFLFLAVAGAEARTTVWIVFHAALGGRRSQHVDVNRLTLICCRCLQVHHVDPWTQGPTYFTISSSKTRVNEIDHILWDFTLPSFQ